ncbi:MAG: hypothetical protein ABUS54_09110 [Actinomycetota bacterium]
MSAVATTNTRAGISDRLLAAVPLASIYLWLSIVYCIEAWKRVTPWLFTDELEFTQLSRSIAATGHAARRGEPHGFGSIYVLLIAPFWRINDVAAAFAAIKYFDVLVMTAVVFPTYFLARLVVGKVPSLFAAAAAGVIPSLAYSSWIVQEVLAYPYATLCFFLIAKALVTKTRWWIAAAAVASVAAPVVRNELLCVPLLVALALIFMWWSSDRMHTRRLSWTYGDWLGAFAIAAGAIILLSGFLSHHSHQWLMNTAYNWTKKRIFVYGDWAAGALAIGIGVAPLAIGLAGLVPVRAEQRSRALRVYRCVATAAIVVFGIYTGMKGAFLSQTFASRSEERNLIYICPLLFVTIAYVLERRRINLWALGAAGTYVVYLMAGVPLFIGNGYYSDALGLAIIQQANRYFLLGRPHARVILVVALVVGLVLTVLATRLRRTAGVVAAGALAVLILAWNVTAEVAAAAGNITSSRDLRPTLGHPFTWVDDATHLKPTLYLGQQLSDQNAEWLLEFWNRSITTVSSLDGTVGGPGPSGAPNILPNGQLYWTDVFDPTDPGKLFDYAVEQLPCITFAGTPIETHHYRGGTWRLVQLTKPNRLRAYCSGIYTDGWSGANDSSYFRFVGHAHGWLRIRLNRQLPRPTGIEIQLGTVAESDKQPVFGRVLRTTRLRLRAYGQRTVWVPTPPGRFVVRTVVDDKVVPSQIGLPGGDVRQLGVKVTYQWHLSKRQ